MNTNKKRLIYKIIILICALVTIGLVTELFIEMIAFHRELPGFFSRVTTGETTSFFASHFTLGICLFLVGIIAFLMPKASKEKYNTSRGDEIIIIVSFLLFLCAIIAIVISFL